MVPSTATGQHAQMACMHTKGHACCPRSEPGLPVCRNGRGKWVDSSLHCSRVHLGHDLPPSSNPFTISRGDGGLKLFPQVSFACSSCNMATDTRCGGLLQAPRLSTGALSIHSRGKAEGLPHPGSFPPALLRPEWGRSTNQTRKKPKGNEL